MVTVKKYFCKCYACSYFAILVMPSPRKKEKSPSPSAFEMKGLEPGDSTVLNDLDEHVQRILDTSNSNLSDQSKVISLCYSNGRKKLEQTARFMKYFRRQKRSMQEGIFE